MYGTFASPNYPSNYPDNANVCWLIIDSSSITLQFNSFETETGRDTLKVSVTQVLIVEFICGKVAFIFVDLFGTNYILSTLRRFDWHIHTIYNNRVLRLNVARIH